MINTQKAPDFSLPDQNNKIVNLSNCRGKWVVLYFYPKDNTFGCTKEALDFSAKLGEFTRRNCVVFGVSADTAESHCSFRAEQKITVNLLSDPKRKVIEEYGVWGVKKQYGKTSYGIIRSTVLISPNGEIKYAWEDVQVRDHVEKVLTKLKEVQANY